MLSHLRKSSIKVYDIAIILAAVGGAAHILIRTSNYGPELDPDTWKYISAAESLAAGDGVKDYLQRSHINAGPLYPMLLALFGLLGVDPIDAGRFVNIVGFGLIILLVGYQLSRQVKFRFLAVVGSVTIMTSYYLSEISTFLMTDTLFVLFVLLALFKIQLFIKSESPPPSLLALSALFTGLAIATRYAGIPVLLTGIILIFLKRNFQILRRLKCAVVYGSLSIIPFGVWMARNWLSEKALFKYDNYGSSTSDYLEKFGKLFVSNILVLSPGLDWFIYLICTAAFLILWRRACRRQSLQQNFPTTDDPKHLLSIILFSIFVIITILMILFMASNLGSADQLNERQLLPVYAPVIIVACFLLDILLRRLLLRWNLLEFALVCLISTGILGSISLSSLWNVKFTAQALETNAEPAIFEEYGFHNMDIWTYLRDNPIDGPVYSNGHFLLYWFTDVPFGGVIQGDRGPRYCLSWVQELAWRSPEPSYIVYFTSQRLGLSRHIFTLLNACNITVLESDPIMQSYLERIGETSEAIIYQVTAKSKPQPNFNVRYEDGKLLYVKEQCTSIDTESSFFLHVIPVNHNVLPNHRIQLGFDNLDFHFGDHGVIHNHKCTITVELPHYDISKIRTGELIRENGLKLWETELSIS